MRPGVESQTVFAWVVRNGEVVDFPGVIQPRAIVVRREHSLHGVSKIWSS